MPTQETVLEANEAYRLSSHRLVQGELEVDCSNPHLLRYRRSGQVQRELPLSDAAPENCPSFSSSLPALEAAYRLAAAELAADITPEGLMLAGANWHTVWTRDIAYAAALGGALAAPAATRASLESRVRDGIILQDTGTGGGWPISTDRVSWAIGAWSYYNATGDRNWLAFAAEVLEKTMAQDTAVLPQTTPLRPGETSFLDWREQSYPAGISSAEIGSFYALGTNAAHYLAHYLLAHMLKLLGRDNRAELREASILAQAINERFWNPGSRQYGMLCTPDGWRDERTDTLATALVVLSGIAGERAADALDRLPRSLWGTPVFTPYKAELKEAYHNRAVWPFVEAYVLLAHAELKDGAAVAFSLSSLLRAALAFGTCKENFHAETGRAEDTLLNSDRQLWSVCGLMGAYYYGLFGLQIHGSNLVLSPCVPQAYRGSHWLTGLHVREMVLDIHLHGFGSEIGAITVNGKPGAPLFPLDTTGRVVVEIELMAYEKEAAFNPPLAGEDLLTPQWDAPNAKLLRWHAVPGAESYCVYRNGRAFSTTFETFCDISAHSASFNEYCVQAIGRHAVSALSHPFACPAPGARRELPPHRVGEEAEYMVEHGQAWLDTRPCTARLDYEEVSLPAGTYSIRFHYCNATASVRDGDTCALRELCVDNRSAGIVVFPHNTEEGRWEDDALTAPLLLTLTEGTHRFSLRLTDRCTNSNGSINQCMVRSLVLTQLR